MKNHKELIQMVRDNLEGTGVTDDMYEIYAYSNGCGGQTSYETVRDIEKDEYRSNITIAISVEVLDIEIPLLEVNSKGVKLAQFKYKFDSLWYKYKSYHKYEGPIQEIKDIPGEYKRTKLKLFLGE